VTTEPTYNTDGEKTRECSCGEKETVTIPKGSKYVRYRWELNDDASELVSVKTNGFTENALTNKVGTITEGVTKGLQYKFTTPVVLNPDKDWSVEWKMSGSIDTWQKILVANQNNGTANDFCLMVTGEKNVTLAKFFNSTHNNYTAGELSSSDINMKTGEYIFRLTNVYNADDGTNTINLYVLDELSGEAVLIGAMDDLTANKTAWINGETITFNYIGTQSKYTLNGATIEYIEVWESGSTAEHTYDEGVVTREPTCAEEGITTFTCSTCGGTKTEPIAKLDHTYGDTPEWIWTGTDSAGYTAAIAFACECGEKYTVEAEVEEEITVEPTETTEGTKVYTATATYNEASYTDTKTVVLPALGEAVLYDKYRWELNEDRDELVSVKTNGYIENALIKKSGTITDGVTDNLQYQFTTPVVLDHTKSWTVEWDMTRGTNTSWQKILAGQLKALSGTENCLMVMSTKTISLSLYTTSKSHNNYSSSAMAASDFNLEDQHTYKLENRVNADGTNTIYLWVDNTPIGTFDTHDSATKPAWLPGADLTFKYIGQQANSDGTKYYGLSGATINYIEVQMEHTHTWGEAPAWTWTGDEENGYTAATATFTCACGDSQSLDAVVTSQVTVEPTEETAGAKVYTATAIFNGETYTAEQTVTLPALGEETGRTGTWYRWELNEDKNELVSVKTSGYTENVLTNKVGTITGGVTDNLQYKFTNSVVLDRTKPWSVEWNMKRGDKTGWQKILATKAARANGDYCIMVMGNATLALGKYTSTHHNYSAGEFASSGISLVDENSYCMKNVYNSETGTNTIYLYVNDVPIGAMDDMGDDYTPWLTDSKITFNYIGQTTYPLAGATINHIEVYLGDAAICDEHSYDAGVNIKNPTCTEAGIKIFTCETCGHSYTENISATGHINTTVTTVEATCTEAGSVTVTCDDCGVTVSTEVIEAKGHTIAQGEAQEKTCTQDGWEAYEYCTECDYTTKVVIPAGHTIAQSEAQEKTCTQDGWAAYEYCTECDYTTKVVIPAGHTLTQVDAKAPTCTEAGYEVYEYCSACDYTTFKEIVATGHVNTTTTTVDATCTTDGSVTVTCNDCGEVVSTTDIPATGEHNYVDGVCSVCGEAELFKIAGANVKIDSSLSMFFYIPKEKIESDVSYYARVTKFNVDDEPIVVTIPMDKWENYNSSFYRVSYNDLMAYMMNDEIHVQIFRPDNIAVSKVWVDSISIYACRIYGNQNDEYKTALVDLLNYGAACQKYFGYDVNNLANKGLTDEQKGMASDVPVLSDSRVVGTNYYGSSLTCDSTLILQFYFTGISDTMTAKITYVNAYGREVTETINGSEFNKRTTTLTGVKVALAAYDAQQLVTCSVYDGEVLVATASDSIESYIARMDSTTDDEIYSMIMRFALSVKAALIA